MACPTCTATMQNLGDGWFWCHRCGTVKQKDRVSIDVPTGVSLARRWVMNKGVADDVAKDWLAESFCTPEERKQNS